MHSQALVEVISPLRVIDICTSPLVCVRGVIHQVHACQPAHIDAAKYSGGADNANAILQVN